VPLDQDALNHIAQQAVDSAVAVHRTLGPGLLESACEACLAYELKERGLQVETQVALPVTYREQRLDVGYRIDILVEQSLIIEVKAVDSILPVHRAQLLSSLRLSNKRLGLLINFNVLLIKNGIVRMVNGL
jgi:GxxExxY protein